jgi:protein-S-isoprenylcysteine O-methyltransferase Ste14
VADFSGQDDPQDHPGVITLPVFIFFGFLVAGMALDFIELVRIPGGAWRYLVGAPLSVFGFLLIVICVKRFRHAGTDPDPRQASSTIVTTGPYRFSRNPIYLSMVLIYLGLTGLWGGLFSLLCLVPALFVMHYGVIVREERYLERKFGETYLNYKESTRRWI